MARFFIIFAGLAALLAGTAAAQIAGTRQPGIWHEGKYLGYEAGHERRFSQPNANGNAPEAHRDTVQPASYYEPAVAYASEQPGYSDYVIDSGWDAAGNCGYPAACCPPPIYMRAELLGWWINDTNLPALVTTSPTGTPANTAGVLGQPGTRVLFGGDEVDQPIHLGGRFTIGRWLDPCECAGMELSYFFVGDNGDNYSANGFDQSILARPFFSTQLNAPAASLIAYPNLLTGSIDIRTSNSMQGFDALYRVRAYANPCSSMTFLAGYRYLNLSESLRINQTSRFTVGQGNIVVGTEQRQFDEFSTENQFHGAQIGFAYSVQRCCWLIETQMKFALGNSHSEVAIDGRTRTTVPGGGSATFVGGLLAQETNIGRRTRDELGFVPELNFTLRRDIGCNLQFLVGYNLLYWTNTARVGNHIDTALSQFPPEPPTGAGRPGFRFDNSGVLLQGLQLGLEGKF